MHYSLIEVITLTVFSMATVFLILTGIMGLMLLSAKLFREKEETASRSMQKTELSAKEQFEEDPLVRAATITVLAAASEETGKTYVIEAIKQIH